MKEAQARLAEADKRLSASLNKIEGELSGVGRQGMSMVQAMMDPNGAGGTKALEAGAMGAVTLSKSVLSTVKVIKALIEKRSAFATLSNLKNSGKRNELGEANAAEIEEADEKDFE